MKSKERESFISWLKNSDNKAVGTANSYATYVSRAENGYGMSIEKAYSIDRCEELIYFVSSELNYLKEKDNRFSDRFNLTCKSSEPIKEHKKLINGINAYVKFADFQKSEALNKTEAVKMPDSLLPFGASTSNAIENRPPVEYKNDIEDNEKLPGLTSYLAREYEKFVEAILINRILSVLFSGEERFTFNIKVLLSKERPYYEYTDSDEITAGNIAEIPEKDTYYYKSEIYDVLKSRTHREPKLGAYFTADGEEPERIEIYYRNFGLDDVKAYKEALQSCLTHQLFHHIHDLYTHETFVYEGLNAKAVKEAIADFGSVAYSVYDSSVGSGAYSLYDDEGASEYAQNRYNRWKKEFGGTWIYSNALHFFYINEIWKNFSDDINAYSDNFKKLLSVIMESKKSMNSAYLMLTGE